VRVVREALRDIDHAERRLGELHPAANAQSIADRFGVPAQLVPTLA
jgi:hypothetical protein